VLHWLKRRHKPDPDCSAGQLEAEQALARESQKLAKAHTETSAILEAAGALKDLGTQNDFAARIKHALGG
jgi:F0F1-type ATP synthase membrane subunit b/b'